MYKTIVNPDTNKKVNINTRLGKQIISKYLIFSQKGGASKSQISEAVILRGIINDNDKIFKYGHSSYEAIDGKLKDILDNLNILTLNDRNIHELRETLNLSPVLDSSGNLRPPYQREKQEVKTELYSLHTQNVHTGNNKLGSLITILNFIGNHRKREIHPKNILNLVIHSTDIGIEGSISRIICNGPGKYSDNIQKFLDLLKLKFARRIFNEENPLNRNRHANPNQIKNILERNGLSDLKFIDLHRLTSYERRTSSNFQEKVETIANFLSETRKGDQLNLGELKKKFKNLTTDYAWTRLAFADQQVEREIKKLTTKLEECNSAAVFAILKVREEYVKSQRSADLTQLAQFLSSMCDELLPFIHSCPPEVKQKLTEGFSSVGWDANNNVSLSTTPPDLIQLQGMITKCRAYVERHLKKTAGP